MQETLYRAGDRVRHTQRPEWGVGTITKAEKTVVRNQPAHRLVIRFSHGGTKTLSTLGAELEVLSTPGEGGERPTTGAAGTNGRATSNGHADHAGGDVGWLDRIEKKSPAEMLREIPEAATDPFKNTAQRLESTIRLYRFNATGGSLIDWAVAQTGLDDPLSELSRQELEQAFEVWARERDAHFGRLLAEAEKSGVDAAQLLAAAPDSARAAAKRLNGRR